MEVNNNSKISTTSFKLLCIVCRQYLKNTDIIYSTSNCGHAFHKHCIFRWFRRDSVCPQCCGYAHEFLLYRLYLNFNEAPQLNEVEAEHIRSIEWRYLDKHVTSEEMSQYGFQLGLDEEGNPIFAARFCFPENLVPGYYIPKLKGLRIGWHNISHFIEKKIEILHITNDNADYEWVAASKGYVPEHAFCVGYNEWANRMYFARCFYKNMLRYGYVCPSRVYAYIVFKKKEVKCKDYEVLVRIPRDKNQEEPTFK